MAHEGRTADESVVTLGQLMLPTDANPSGDVHGGVVMKLVDTAAGLTAMRHARSRFGPTRIVLSGATFNRRAITVYERAGFAPVRIFTHWTNGGEWEFVEMQRSA